MATVSSKKLVEEIIAGGGHYSDDPPVLSIYEITSRMHNKTEWVLCYSAQDEAAIPRSPSVTSFNCIFRYPGLDDGE